MWMPIDLMKLRRLGLLLGWTLSIGGCASPLAAAQPPDNSPAREITAITLERDCFGCPTGSILTLHRDGSARLTTSGKARRGTQDKTATGTVSAADFDALARLAVAQGFFELKDVYEDPQLKDGAWVTTRITRAGQDTQVFRRDEAGPAALKTVEAAIEALKAQISFAPERR